MDEEAIKFLNRVVNNKDELQTQLIDTLQKTVAVLTKQRDEAIKHLAAWGVAIDVKGGSWDDWDEYYKDVMHRENALPSIRDHLKIAIEKERKTYER